MVALIRTTIWLRISNQLDQFEEKTTDVFSSAVVQKRHNMKGQSPCIKSRIKSTLDKSVENCRLKMKTVFPFAGDSVSSFREM